MDLRSVNNLLEFLEKVFNGGSGAGAFAGGICAMLCRCFGRRCAAVLLFGGLQLVPRIAGACARQQGSAGRARLVLLLDPRLILPLHPPTYPNRLQCARPEVPGPADRRQVGQLRHSAGALLPRIGCCIYGAPLLHFLPSGPTPSILLVCFTATSWQAPLQLCASWPTACWPGGEKSAVSMPPPLPAGVGRRAAAAGARDHAQACGSQGQAGVWVAPACAARTAVGQLAAPAAQGGRQLAAGPGAPALRWLRTSGTCLEPQHPPH